MTGRDRTTTGGRHGVVGKMRARRRERETAAKLPVQAAPTKGGQPSLASRLSTRFFGFRMSASESCSRGSKSMPGVVSNLRITGISCISILGEEKQRRACWPA